MNTSSSPQDNYSFKFTDFDTSSGSLLRSIRYDTDFKDVSLACDMGMVSAHKVIVSGCSSVLRSLLQKNPHPHPLIYFRGVNLIDLRALLDFIYKGECLVSRDSLTSFLALAEELKVNGLSESVQASKLPLPLQENNNIHVDELLTVRDKNHDKEVKCDDTLPDEVMLLANISEENGPEGRMFKCDLCSKTCKKKNNLLSHIESKHFPDMFSHKCKYCGKKYNCRKSMWSHCRVCPKRLN